jgi:hypothetical protein
LRCEYKAFKKIKLCPSDLTHEISFMLRATSGSHPDDIAQVSTALTLAYKAWGAVETVSPLKPVMGLNIKETITHVLYFRHSDILALDIQKHILNDGVSTYRIIEAMNLNGFNETYALFCVKRGDGNESLS